MRLPNLRELRGGRDEDKVVWRAPEEVSPAPSGTFMLELSTSGSTAKASLFFISGMSVIVILLIILAMIWKCIKPETLKKMLRSTKSFQVSKFCGVNFRTINYFDIRTLKKATGNFHPTNQIGIGGFGPVYKGILDDGTMIAVKQLSLSKSRQGESQFLAEVRVITSIQHRNLVRLIGCCLEGEERLLVYEYMENGSLDNIIYGETEMILSWHARFHIILGIARGLQYLHEESNLKVIHRDIKASNILLDDKFQPKISDFGLARSFHEDQASFSCAVAGTLGYTAPEYAMKGELSEKADIYSFGVLALEIISCRKNTDLTKPAEMQYLPEYAWKLYERSRVLDLVDPELMLDELAESEIIQVCQAAMLCLQPNPSSRPAMSEIVSMLTWNSEPTVTPMRPAFLDRVRKINRIVSPKKSVHEVHSSPLHTESLSFPETEMSSTSSYQSLMGDLKT